MLKFQPSDIIVALATPVGQSAIAVIRVSGIGSIDLVNSILKSKDLRKQPSHTIHFGTILDEQMHPIDEVLVSIFLGEKSFTKEDSVEISCHGSIIIINKILNILINKGARLATRGEFTKRAFLNGRFDLTQAEAVAEIIHSDSEKKLKFSISQLKGHFKNNIQDFKTKIINLASLLELELDFSEENLEFASRSQFQKLLTELKLYITNLINTFIDGKAIRDGIAVAIVGKPNAGKSTLLNILVGEERAIVSSIPGTTRDLLYESIYIDGIKVTLVDTAGIRSNVDNEIERLGIERALQQKQKSDIVIELIDSTQIVPDLFIKTVSNNQNSNYILCISKIELANQNIINIANNYDIISISSKKNIGIESLKKAIIKNISSINSEALVMINSRHKDILEKINTSINLIQTMLSNLVSTEFIMQELRYLISLMGEITGEVVNDDILDNIFSKFCIGK